MYRNKRIFRLWEYSISHESLLIRSEKQYEDVIYENKYYPNITIDIEFWGVRELNIPSKFHGIKISKIISFEESQLGLKKFLINDNYYVISAGCLIGGSNWDSDETRIRNPNLNYNEIFKTW